MPTRSTAVTFVRLDSLAANDPNRFVSGIHVDPANPNRAWISYSGFDATTPTTPGHVFEVTYNPGRRHGDVGGREPRLRRPSGQRRARETTSPATCMPRPISACSVLLRARPMGCLAAPGMPNVEVAGLTIVPSDRKLYAATHGLGAWRLNLP